MSPPAPQWTTEQVLALAPDAASAKNGRGLATRRKWVSLGSQTTDSGRVVWGECQGSGKTPYRTQIDLSEPAFRCSCPSRKFPCKHGLGLFLLLAEQPQEITEAEPPDWVTEWIASRSQRAEKQAQKQAKQQEKAADPVAQAKRATARLNKMQAGVQDLQLWLQDRIRQGLATLPQESYQMWDGVAARLVDAQAPGLARQVRDLAGVVHTGTGWSDRLLAQFGQLYLLTQGFERLDSLPTPIQADLRTQLGWAFNQEEVLNGEDTLTQTDVWVVLGQSLEADERLKTRRTWLYGVGQSTLALLLDFAYGTQSFEQTLLLGTCLEAELAFYPSAYPLRALIKTRQEAVPISQPPPGYGTVGEAIAAYSRALAQSPWLERFPLLLSGVVPLREGDRWLIQDSQSGVLPLTARLESSQGWQLLALSGGHPLTLFGEWDGNQLIPLSAWVEERVYGFGG